MVVRKMILTTILHFLKAREDIPFTQTRTWMLQFLYPGVGDKLLISPRTPRKFHDILPSVGRKRVSYTQLNLSWEPSINIPRLWKYFLLPFSVKDLFQVKKEGDLYALGLQHFH
jgi:hypothetical protein